MKHTGTAIITGGAGGIGFEIATVFGEKGYDIVILDINKNALESAEKILTQKGITTFVYEIDITNRENVSQVTTNIISTISKPLKILIHCAAINKIELFSQDSIVNFEKIYRVNVLGTVNVSGYCVDELKKNRGSIICFSSVAGFAPLYSRTSYSASKYALHGFFDTLRTEIGNLVNIMMVCPTFVDTNFSRDKNTKNINEILSPKQVAMATWKGYVNKKKLHFVGNTAKLAYWIYKFFPSVYLRKMMKQNVI